MKLIATDITNLTDARYFAARGAHMIGFNTTLSTPDEINAIKEWVDVPEFFLHLPDNASAELIWEWQDRTGISNFLFSDFDEDEVRRFPDAQIIYFPRQLDNLSGDVHYLIIASSLVDAWLQLKNNTAFEFSDIPTYVEYKNEMNIDEKVVNEFNGVIITGSTEEKIGVKSYDDIDDFLDQLDIEY